MSEELKALETVRADLDKLIEKYKVKSDKERTKINEECAGCTEWLCDCSNVRRMAIEEFAERLHSLEVDIANGTFVVLISKQIDEIAESMKGEK